MSSNARLQRKKYKSMGRKLMQAVFALIALGIILSSLGIGSLQSHARAASARPSDSSGQWQIVPSPSPGQNNQLYAVSAISTTDVWAVGTTNGSGFLAEHWDGSSWTATNPFSQLPDVVPTSIGVITSSDIWVVGIDNNGSDQSAFIAHYDGTGWSLVASPNTGAPFSSLNGIAVISTSDIWAMGSIQGNSPLMEHYDGISWSIVPTPSAIATNVMGLTAMCALQDGEIWASGYSSGNSWVVHYDGSQWTVTQFSWLGKLVCSSPTSVWGLEIGNYPGNPQHVYHYDGNTWSSFSTSNGNQNSHQGLAVLSDTDIWTVGGYYDSTLTHTLTEHYDGTQSTVIPSPDFSGATGDNLTAVSAISTTDVWAVGYYTNSQGEYTLIEHYVASAPPQRHKLFEFLQGFDTSLDSNGDIPTDSFGAKNGIYPFLKKNFPGADFLMFSYNPIGSSGYPAYSCADTFSQPIDTSVGYLRKQIVAYLNTHSDTDVYLVGHSFGGALSLGLLEDMYRNGYITTNGGQIKGVVTLDSPLGGIPAGPNNQYLNALQLAYTTSCKTLSDFTPLLDLTQVFTSGNKPFGARDLIDPGSSQDILTNQAYANLSAHIHKIPILTIGNMLDFIYNFSACPGWNGMPDNEYLRAYPKTRFWPWVEADSDRFSDRL
jgi:pimeloyl-ACP methyl ester carboxylesterase